MTTACSFINLPEAWLSFCTLPTQMSIIVSTKISIIIKIRKFKINTILSKYSLIQNLPTVPIFLFIAWHSSLISFDLSIFLDFFLSLWLMFWEKTGQLFCRLRLNLDLSDCSAFLLRLCIFGRNTTMYVVLCPHCIIPGRNSCHSVLILMITLVTGFGWYLPDFSL